MSYRYQKNEPGYDDGYDMPATNYQQSGYRDDPNTGAYSNAGYNQPQQYPMTSPNAAAASPYAVPQKKRRNKWLWIGLPLLLAAIIIAAVVGGVVGSRNSKSKNLSTNASSDNTGSGTSGSGSSAAASQNTVSAGVGSTATGANGAAYLAVATDTYMLPVYATGTATSGYSEPTVVATPASSGAWPSDPSPPSTATPRSHPRLIAPAYKWDALKSDLIANDPYLKYWNATIFQNASDTLNDPVQPYDVDGGLDGSGILDPARIIKLKVKNWAYVYRMTNDTTYAERIWSELQNAAGNGTEPFPSNNTCWNPKHFLDVAEMSNAFAIGYDWLYDYWSADQKQAIMWSIINNGLYWGYGALSKASYASDYNWWAGTAVGNDAVAGNWNCVINGGLTMAALAILGDDTSGIAQQTLDLTVDNAKANCALAVHDDGTWAETANYWYFGTTGMAEMSSALETAYGDDQGLLSSNSAWNLTSLFHIYVQGMTSLFNYGDHGPNKYSSTANGLLRFADYFNEPRYALYQRDHYDSSEPWSMFWYNPAYDGTWWDGLPLDHHFTNFDDEWYSSRNTWSDNNGNFFAMKSGYLQGHQTHQDIDIGDFVIDALGQRWAGELGSGQYLSDGYFSSEAQNSERWLYYRKRTEGQNTILLNYQNQNVMANVTSTSGSTGESQGAAPTYDVPSGSTAYFTTDMTNAYNGTSIKRGIRFINDRKQILVQDDVDSATTDVMWRMHTNATMAFDSGNTTVTLSLGGETLKASIINGPSGATFTQMPAERFSFDPPLPTNADGYDADQPNGNTTVLAITVTGGGTFSLQVLFNPQYSGATDSDYVTPTSVSIDDWSTTSHN